MKELSILVRLMRIHAEHGMVQRAIGFPEQMVLMALSSGEAMNQDSIAKTLDIDKGAIARTISKLEAKGLISREENPLNRREKLVRITSASDEVLCEMRDNLSAFMEKAFKGFSAEEREQIAKSFSMIVHNLSE